MKCTRLKETTKFIGDWLHNQPTVKEDALTEFLLYQISQIFWNVRYKTFSSKDEGLIYGADWEWWIVFSDGAYKMRVQAKKERKKKFYLHKKSPKAKMNQMEMLIDNAEKNNYIPFYMLYSTTNNGTLCSSSRQWEGVFISSAYKVYNLCSDEGKMNLASSLVIENSLLLSCLFCCSSLSKKSVHVLTKFWDDFFELEKEEFHYNLHNSTNKLGLYKEVPNYVDIILSSSNYLEDWYENEFRHEFEDLNGIFVLDMR